MKFPCIWKLKRIHLYHSRNAHNLNFKNNNSVVIKSINVHLNLWNAIKEVLVGKCKALSTCILKEEKLKNNEASVLSSKKVE